jgi:hypothetical protein
MHTDANIHACATLSIIYYYKTYSYNNRVRVTNPTLYYSLVVVLCMGMSL